MGGDFILCVWMNYNFQLFERENRPKKKKKKQRAKIQLSMRAARVVQENNEIQAVIP